MKHNAWILVANGDKARIFKVEKVGVLLELHDFIDPAARLKNSELLDDKPGRGFDKMGGGSHGMENQNSPHHKEQQHFAKTLALFLESARQKKEFENLYIVAEPRFLGMLRQTLNPHTIEQVAGELAKDLVTVEIHALWAHLPFAS